MFKQSFISSGIKVSRILNYTNSRNPLCASASNYNIPYRNLMIKIPKHIDFSGYIAGNITWKSSFVGSL